MLNVEPEYTNLIQAPPQADSKDPFSLCQREVHVRRLVWGMISRSLDMDCCAIELSEQNKQCSRAVRAMRNAHYRKSHRPSFYSKLYSESESVTA